MYLNADIVAQWMHKGLDLLRWLHDDCGAIHGDAHVGNFVQPQPVFCSYFVSVCFLGVHSILRNVFIPIQMLVSSKNDVAAYDVKIVSSLFVQTNAIHHETIKTQII